MKNEYKIVQRSVPFSGSAIKDTLPITSDLYHVLKEKGFTENIFVHVNGVYIPQTELINVVLVSGDVVEVDIVPEGSTEDHKTAMRTIAFIAIAVLAVYAGPIIAPSSPMLASMVTVGITVGGSLAINALIPPPEASITPPSGGVGSPVGARDYLLNSTSNNYTPYAPIPKVFGYHRMYPPKASLEYTELIGNEQYLNSLFCLGYGPLTVTEVKIGDVDIDDFGDSTYEIGTYASPPSSFPALVDEQSLSTQLAEGVGDAWGAYTTVFTEANTRKISLDVYCPVLYDPDRTTWIDFRIEVSLNGGAWAELDPAADPAEDLISRGTNLTIKFVDGVWIRRVYGSGNGAVRTGVYWDVPTVGTWGVRIQKRNSDTDASEYTVNATYITALRSFIDANPINTTDDSIVYMATRLRATNKLNGVVNDVNCMCQATHPSWNGSAWADIETRNPAWAFADLLLGDATHDPLSTDRLDGDELKAWADICDTEGFSFDAILIKKVIVNDFANQICSVGRATPAIKDGLHTVVIDQEQTTPAQIFTSRNSWGFVGSKLFTDNIHGFKVNFVNEDKGYVLDEVVVYDDGYNSGNATKFEKLSFNGVTNSDHAWKLGRYHIAVNRLRPETYEINTDVENIRCTRGDMVYLNHDVILVGLGSARIKTLTLEAPVGDNTDFEIVMDDKKILENSETYAINVRTNSGTIYTIVIDTPALTQIDTDTFTGTTTTTIANAMAVGNLFQFGESGTVTDEMVVQYIVPGRDLTAKLTLVHYNAAILTADQGTIPAFNSNITQPPDPTKFVPPAPYISQVTSDETVIITQEDGSLMSRIVINFNITSSGHSAIPRSVEAQYKLTNDASGGWVSVPAISAAFDTVSILEVKDGVQYTVRIRFVSSYGVPSEWTEIIHTVAGKTAAPPDVTGFTAVFVDNQVELRWTASTVADIRNYRLSYGASVGDNDLGFTDTSTFRTPALWSGTRTFWVVAIDTSGNSSNGVSVALINVPPTISSLTAEVIDNNVLLRWVNVQGSLPIISNEVRKGDVYASPDKTIGTKTGSFTTFQETAADTYTYWVTANDSAGNTGPAVSLIADVSEPPDFVLYTHVYKGFADGSLYTNCFSHAIEDKLYIPVNIAETWTQHFVNNSNTSFQDFIDDSYVTYAEPSLLTGEYNEEFDVGAVVPAAIINVLLNKTDVGSGTVTVDTYIETKLLIGDSWTTGSAGTTLHVTNFRYIRIRYDVTSSDDKTYTVFNTQTIDVSIKEKTDAGNGTYTASYALTSDETSDYSAAAADSVSLDITGSVSIAAWVRLPTVTTTGTTNIAFKTYYGLRYDATAGQISGGGSQGYTTWDIDSDWDGHWVYIVDVITASAHKLYINGDEVDSQSGYSPTTTTNSLYVLGDGSTGGCPASVSDVRVYSGELTAAEVDEMYRDSTATPSATLAAQWDFTEGTGTTAADTSGNSNTMTLSSASMWDDDQGGIVFFNKTFIDIESLNVTASIDTVPTTMMYDFLDIPYPEYFHVIPYNSTTGVRKSSAYSWNARGK